jgi:hypothetical protein
MKTKTEAPRDGVELEALALEGLDYFYKAGDDGDRVYVDAIRKLLASRPQPAEGEVALPATEHVEEDGAGGTVGWYTGMQLVRYGDARAAEVIPPGYELVRTNEIDTLRNQKRSAAVARHGGEGGALASIAWVGQVRPSTDEHGSARVSMTWEEFNAMRVAAGLKPQPPAKPEKRRNDQPTPTGAVDESAALEAMRAEEMRVFGEYKTPVNGARLQCMRAALTAAVSLGVPLFFFGVFERWFLVALPKGPLEAYFGF